MIKQNHGESKIRLFINNFKATSQQPTFVRKVAGAYFDNLMFDPKNSTTESILNNDRFYVRLGGKEFPLKEFDLAIRTEGLACHFNETKEEVKMSDFKVVRLEDLANPLENIPESLQHRPAHMDAF